MPWLPCSMPLPARIHNATGKPHTRWSPDGHKWEQMQEHPPVSLEKTLQHKATPSRPRAELQVTARAQLLLCAIQAHGEDGHEQADRHLHPNAAQVEPGAFDRVGRQCQHVRVFGLDQRWHRHIACRPSTENLKGGCWMMRSGKSGYCQLPFITARLFNG